jgi:hypothetical protein
MLDIFILMSCSQINVYRSHIGMNMGKRAQNKFNGKRGLLLTVDRNISILVLVCE